MQTVGYKEGSTYGGLQRLHSSHCNTSAPKKGRVSTQLSYPQISLWKRMLKRGQHRPRVKKIIKLHSRHLRLTNIFGLLQILKYCNGRTPDACARCVANVLLLLALGIVILGLSMKVSAMLVKSVTNCLIRKVILITTSGPSIRVRNHIPVLNVVKTSQIGVILDDTPAVSTRQSGSTPTASSEKKNEPPV